MGGMKKVLQGARIDPKPVTRDMREYRAAHRYGPEGGFKNFSTLGDR